MILEVALPNVIPAEAVRFELKAEDAVLDLAADSII